MGFIDELIEGFGKEVDNIKARSQILIKAYNFSQEMRELEQRKKELLLAIGKVIYAKYQDQISPDEESLKQKCIEIASLEKDIAQLQEQLDRLKTPESNSSCK